MTTYRILHRFLGVGFLLAATAMNGQTPVADSATVTAAIPMHGTLWSLGAGVASGEKGIAGFISTSWQRRLLSTELRLSYAGASAPTFPFGSPENERGPISALEVAALGGIGRRSQRTLSAVRVGLGYISKTQCMQGCGFFYSGPSYDERLRTLGLALAAEAGVLLGRRHTVGLTAIAFGNLNTAHSFWSGGGRISFGHWK